METPENIFLRGRASLAAKKARAMLAIESVAKSGRNDFFKYDYAKESDYLKAIRGPLAEEGIAFSFSIDQEETTPHGETRNGQTIFQTRLWITFRLVCADTGYEEETRMVGLGNDTEDKGVNKALVGALKYYVAKTFLVPTDDADGDSANEDAATARYTGNRSNARRNGNGGPSRADDKPAVDPEAVKLIAEINKSGGTLYGTGWPKIRRETLSKLKNSDGESPKSLSDLPVPPLQTIAKRLEDALAHLEGSGDVVDTGTGEVIKEDAARAVASANTALNQVRSGTDAGPDFDFDADDELPFD